MKLIVLHLSGIHFKETKSANQAMSRIEKIAAATSSAGLDARCCFLVVSGDIAFSGKSAEYAIANEFLAKLRDLLQKKLLDCSIHVILVPGNHDCVLAQENNVREAVLNKLRADHLPADMITECAKVQENYSAFAAQWRPAGDASEGGTSLHQRLVIEFGGHSIEFHLLNTAWMSSLKEIKLLFPLDLLPVAGDTPSSKLAIAVMHHPYNWFDPDTGRGLRKWIDASSDILLTGHEHERDDYLKQGRSGETIEYVEGGVLQNPENYQSSSFNVLVLDLDEEKRQLHQFTWTRQSLYEADSPTPWIPFQRNSARLRTEFRVNDAFKKSLQEMEADFTPPGKEQVTLSDLFVYPDLRRLLPVDGEGQRNELISDQIPQLVLKQHNVLILGGEKSGKTALAKMLFQDLRKAGLVPVLISGRDLRKPDEEAVVATVEEGFKQQYVAVQETAFRQLDRAQKAIIVDDFHRVRANARGRDQIATTLANYFETVVLLGNMELQMVDFAARGTERRKLWDFEQYTIRPLGLARRADLIKKWVFLGRMFTEDEAELYERARQTEGTISTVVGRNFVPAYPIYILLLLQHLETNNPVPVTSTTSSYGYLFESLLTLHLSVRPDAGLDTQYTYLSELAYTLFTKKARSLSLAEARAWHEKYCQHHASILDFGALIEYFCGALILIRENDTLAFRYPYLYYYSVGRYLRDHIGEEAIQDNIRQICKRLYHKESANILVFLCYFSRDPFILSTVLETSRGLFASDSECDLIEDTKFLNDLIGELPQLMLDATNPEENREKALKQRDADQAEEDEKNWDEIEDDKTLGQNEELRQFLQINAAVKTIQILGQILRNHEGFLTRDQKLELAQECYSLGLRVLKFFIDLFKSAREDVTKMLIDIVQSRHPRYPAEKIIRDLGKLWFFFVEFICLSFVKHISSSVGLENLAPTFDHLIVEKPTLSYQFIDLSVRIDHYRTFPKDQTFKLYHQVERHSFAAQLLRQMIWQFFSFRMANDSLRQSVCKRLGIELKKLPPQIHS